MPADPLSEPAPYRVVDRENYGWHATIDRENKTIYSAGYGDGRDLPDLPYPEVVAQRSPLRPVLPVTDADETALGELFTRAGRKTITSLAAALETVFHELRETRGGWRAGGDNWDYAKRTMVAGRPGSWESVALIDVILFGNSMNLAKPTRQLQDVDKRRAAGPVKRVDKAVRDEMASIFRQWVTGPERYTEVAETLASVVSGYCDRQAEARGLVPDRETITLTLGVPRPAGWPLVADQWLQPASLAREDFTRCYRLLYNLSSYFQAGLL